MSKVKYKIYTCNCISYIFLIFSGKCWEENTECGTILIIKMFNQVKVLVSMGEYVLKTRIQNFDCMVAGFICNQCLSPLKLWVWILCRSGVHDITLCDKVYQSLATGWWFSPGTPVSSTNKTDHHDITKILVKVVLNIIIQTLYTFFAISY